MNKQSILYAIASVLLVAYLGVALVWASRQASEQQCAGLYGGAVEVITPPGADSRFVTSEEMTRQLGSLAHTMATRRLADINLDSLSRELNALDKLEYATVNVLANNQVRVRVYPMVPMARVWDHSGSRSFYINRDGKRMTADARFSLDVPQISGRFSRSFGPERLIPLFDYMNLHPEWHCMITMITVRDSADVILVPAVRGHVVNFGSVSSIPSKFERLKRFYSDVMPVRGWDYYDTLSVKWDGQIVATRRSGKLPASSLEIIEELENEGDTPETMNSELN